jgi:late competence protein required for DNA uptake (superfamily II DNA/RNA helicase)
LVFKGRAHERPAVTLHGFRCVLRLRHPILDFCVMTQKSCDNRQFRVVACSRQLFFCKEEFDEKLIDCVRSFPVIYDLSKKSYKDKIAKDNAWKNIATALERDGKFSV